MSLYSFTRLPLIIPLSYIPPKSFNCTTPPSVTILRMIWCILLMICCIILMINFKLLSHSPNSVVNEVSALVTHQNSWESKSSDHLLK
jgi:hypothetical protein